MYTMDNISGKTYQSTRLSSTQKGTSRDIGLITLLIFHILVNVFVESYFKTHIAKENFSLFSLGLYQTSFLLLCHLIDITN